MGLPAKQRTRTSKRQRASHFALKKTSVQADEKGNPHLPHTVNPVTGMYKGRQVVDVEKRAKRALKRAKRLGKIAS